MNSLTVNVVVLALMAIASYCEAQKKTTVWEAGYYPNPEKRPDLCRREGRSRVCDPNTLLKDGEANKLDELIRGVEENTECACQLHHCFDNKGYRIGVALAKKIKDPAKKERGTMLHGRMMKGRRFAYHIKYLWKLGACTDDVIIIYSKDDKVFYTIVGKTAAKKLKARLIGRISVAANKYFERGDIFKGLKHLIQKYELVFQDKFEKVSPNNVKQ